MGALDHVPQLHQQKCFQYDADFPAQDYNRFRYYSPQIGIYISSDPIGLAGNNPTLYGYVGVVNTPENVAHVLSNTYVYEITSIDFPEGLAIKSDGKEVGDPIARGHNTIYNTRDMTVSEFESKLSQIETNRIGKFNKDGKFVPSCK